MMTKRLLICVMALLPLCMRAQLLSQPLPLMYRAMSEVEAPPAHAKRIVVSRYIPGARFPHSWDVQLEERNYDPQGHLTNWKRFDSYSGIRMFEKRIIWNAQGDRVEERTWRAEAATEEAYKFANEYGPDGKFKGAAITDDRGKPAGSIVVQADGSRVTTIGATPGKRVSFTSDAQGRMLSSSDEATKQETRYVYDAKGELTAVEQVRGGATTTIQYKNTYDDKGRIIMQEEQLPQGVRKMLFEYNDKGQLVARKWEPVRPAEVYGYGPYGQLSDIMQFSQEGYPKESQAFWTEFYR